MNNQVFEVRPTAYFTIVSQELPDSDLTLESAIVTIALSWMDRLKSVSASRTASEMGFLVVSCSLIHLQPNNTSVAQIGVRVLKLFDTSEPVICRCVENVGKGGAAGTPR
jgi:hypothetical protein